MATVVEILENTSLKMMELVEAYKEELQKLRVGSANPEKVKNTQVDVYGNFMPLFQVATIAVPSAITVVITPWDKNNMKAIADALQKELAGEATPTVKDTSVYINYPPLTQEKKEEFVKILKDKAEQIRQRLRDVRQDAKSTLEDQKKNGELPEDSFFKAIEDLDEQIKKSSEEVNTLYEQKKEQLLK